MLNGNNKTNIEDTNIKGYSPLVSPYQIKQQIPLSEKAAYTIGEGRSSIVNILEGEERKLIVVGPCSIHDVKAAKDYAERLMELRKKVRSVFEIVMRVYFEKPRTTVGWKGLIYEPYLDGKENINEGLSIARQLLRDILEMGLPSGTEFLDPFVPQYIADLVAWGAIGARTVESPQHRQMASGLSMPVGFKNSTQGNIEVAINALLAARHDNHSFFGLNPYGIPAVISTKGNLYVHLILRGGDDCPNYDSESVRRTQARLREAGLDGKLMIDCSHGNSNKDHKMQPKVFEEVIKQIVDGNHGIMGLMVESNINEGNQKVPNNLDELRYGVSITDACIGWDVTQRLIFDAFKLLSNRK